MFGAPKTKDLTPHQVKAAHDAQGDDWNNEVFPPIRDLREVLARCGVPNGARPDPEKRIAAE